MRVATEIQLKKEYNYKDSVKLIFKYGIKNGRVNKTLGVIHGDICPEDIEMMKRKEKNLVSNIEVFPCYGYQRPPF